MKHRVPKVIAIWMYENEQARWFEFAPPHDDLPDDVTVTKMVPQRTWVNLTVDEKMDICERLNAYNDDLIDAIEAKLKEKNT